MDYLKIHFDTKKAGLKESAIRLYPLVCLHLGAAQCDLAFVQEHIQRIKKDPNGYAVYLGDGGECALKNSKGDVYTQILSPQQQIDALGEILDPVKGKILAAFQGNHGRRVDKESGLSFDKTLALRLGVPYLGLSAFMNLIVNRSSYELYFHHGSDSSTSIRAKVASAENFGKFIDADAIFTAHSHVAMELQPAALLRCDNAACKVHTKLRHQFICGSAYDSRSGYAEEKGYSPLLPSYLSVHFDGRIIEGVPQKQIESRIYRSDGTSTEAERVKAQLQFITK
jgi:hypothetical protein